MAIDHLGFDNAHVESKFHRIHHNILMLSLFHDENNNCGEKSGRCHGTNGKVLLREKRHLHIEVTK